MNEESNTEPRYCRKCKEITRVKILNDSHPDVPRGGQCAECGYVDTLDKFYTKSYLERTGYFEP